MFSAPELHRGFKNIRTLPLSTQCILVPRWTCTRHDVKKVATTATWEKGFHQPYPLAFGVLTSMLHFTPQSIHINRRFSCNQLCTQRTTAADSRWTADKVRLKGANGILEQPRRVWSWLYAESQCTHSLRTSTDPLHDAVWTVSATQLVALALFMPYANTIYSPDLLHT